MEPEAPLLGTAGVVAALAYLAALVAIGVAARRLRDDSSLADFYLAGRGLGLGVLFLTLYATQYSGLTLVGFAGNFYRRGFSFLTVVSFASAIGTAYLWYAPRLHSLSRSRGYVTIGDYLDDRFGSPALTAVAGAVFIFALSAYLLSNLKAIGYVVEFATGGAVGFVPAIVSLAVLMVVYENLGGMRAVAWTDVLQGTILMGGCVALFVVVVAQHGDPTALSTQALATRPELLAPPDWAARVGWLSTLVLVGAGVSIYPHAIQRIYAARDLVVLRRALQLMLVTPFVTTALVLYVGYVGAVRFPGLGVLESERVIFVVLQDLALDTPGVGILVGVLLCAVVAAIMSTIDSALLAVSSIVTADLYTLARPQASEAHLTRVGKAASWLLMAAMVVGAILLPQTLWRITEVKLEVLCQAAPAILWGLFDSRLTARAVLTGLVAGLIVTAALFVAAARPLGMHAGVAGLGVNLGVILVFLAMDPRRR